MFTFLLLEAAAPQKDLFLSKRIKWPPIEKTLNSDEYMRTADVMIDFLNIKKARQIFAKIKLRE